MRVCGKDIRIQGTLIRIARLQGEGYDFVENPDAALADVRTSGERIDLFTFTQKLPDTVPRYTYPMERDNVAALPVSTFDRWWTHQIDFRVRNKIRKAETK